MNQVVCPRCAELGLTRNLLASALRDNAQLTQQVTDIQERASSLMLELQAARFEREQLRARLAAEEQA
jgi:regulator of replication initiation timing